jgi:hypothetical protein
MKHINGWLSVAQNIDGAPARFFRTAYYHPVTTLLAGERRADHRKAQESGGLSDIDSASATVRTSRYASVRNDL